MFSSIAKEDGKDLTTWETYLKEKLKKKKKTREASIIQESEEKSEIVMLY